MPQACWLQVQKNHLHSFLQEELIHLGPFSKHILLNFFLLFIFERERERERVSRGGAEREGGDPESEAGYGL